jgi:NAD(P)-dependent dehydrogenase (short-subunit alcohol dehydrogenase family)
VSIVEPGTIATPMWAKPQRAIEEFPAEAAELYGARITRFRQQAAAASGRAEPTAKVADAVVHALTSEKPRTRYLVGRDAKRRARVQKLPDRVRDRLLVKYLFG